MACQGQGYPPEAPWQRHEDVGWATLNWVDWLNNRRLLEPIGNIPPTEAEAAHYSQITAYAKAA
jgi:transposase InsO family protein